MKQSHRPTAEAFERLCAPYSGMVYRHCLHMLGNPHEAEDAGAGKHAADLPRL